MITIRMPLKKGPKRFFWIKIGKYRILCFPREKKRWKSKTSMVIFSIGKVLPNECLIYMPKGKGHGLKRMGKQGPLLWRCWSQGPWLLWQPPCQAAVNKASTELKNGNEFLIADTLYLSSWQRSDCTEAFLFCPCVRITSPYVPPHDTPYLPGSLTCEERRKT